MLPARKTKKPIAIVAIIALLMLIVAVTPFGRTIILRPFDNHRLASFARKISSADRAVVSVSGGPAILTFTTTELEKVLRGISSGTSARMPDGVFMSSYVATVTFYRGTNVLGEINMSDQLFGFAGSPQYYDKSTLLNRTIYIPLRQKRNEAYATSNE